MQKRSGKASLVLILFLAVAILIAGGVKRLIKRNNSGENIPATESDQDELSKHRGWRRNHTLDYTKHARCRMDCRHISEEEVLDILDNGNVNYRKSDVNDTPCPTYALEGITKDNQHVRIVFAACDHVNKVVTCIDLENDYECDCR